MAMPENLTDALAALDLSQRVARKADEFDGEMIQVTVTLPDSERTATFTVCGPRRSFNPNAGLLPASVNWSGLGECSLDDAAAFAETLAYCASVLAPTMQGPVDA